MNKHYSDYKKMSVPVNDLVFDKIQDCDKELLKKVRGQHIRANAGFLVLLFVCFGLCTWFFVHFLIIPPDNIFYQIISLLMLGAGMFITGNAIYGIIGGIKGIRKGIVLTASREQEVKDGRNYSYQYVVDIFFDDRNETLMSYSISQEVFSEVNPGDGVIVVKTGRKIKVLQDPERKNVMNVSNIKSNV
ncbi:MAG: hypothetical protein IKG30_05335 [Clostridiales bacterium]|nr:hypothetical protein [Clostridiales bacterium]